MGMARQKKKDLDIDFGPFDFPSKTVFFFF